MIKITITKTISYTKKEPKNFIIKSTPTEITENAGYGSKVKDIEEYEVREVESTYNKSITLLEQEIEEDADFDLANVVKAINRLEHVDQVARRPSGG